MRANYTLVIFSVIVGKLSKLLCKKSFKKSSRYSFYCCEDYAVVWKWCSTVDCNVSRVLLQAGANVNALDLDGWTPLHAAAHWGHRDACQLLVENLCDINIKDSFVSYSPIWKLCDPLCFIWQCHFITAQLQQRTKFGVSFSVMRSRING